MCRLQGRVQITDQLYLYSEISNVEKLPLEKNHTYLTFLITGQVKIILVVLSSMTLDSTHKILCLHLVAL